MSKRNRRIAIGAAFGMLVLIFDGKTALIGATEGIQLCINTLIPSLFPFFVFSILLTGALSGQALPMLQSIAHICKIPKGAESLLAIGFLGGYPVGAQNIALLYHNGQLSRAQAIRMVAFCNNAGPAFIFGVLGTMFTDGKIPWILWLIHIISALLVGLLLPVSNSIDQIESHPQKVDITNALAQSIKVMSLVCGWVILMRMILAFMERWFFWFLPHSLQIAISGILELSNGCIRLGEINCEGLRFVMAAGLLSLGGVCVALQTSCITDNISLKLYFPGKILQCCLSIILGSMCQFFFPPRSRCIDYSILFVSTTLILLILIFLRHSEKNSRIPIMIGV